MVWREIEMAFEALHSKARATSKDKFVNTKPKIYLVLLIIMFFTDFVTLLDILFLRQIFGFVFLTVLPGLLIFQILKLDKLGYTEKFVMSVGLSVSFLMLFGLMINNLSLALGYETPLATIPLLISFNIAFIVLAIVGQMINKTQTFSLPNFNLSASEKAFLIIPILFPALSIFGSHLMNTANNNTILILLLFLIPIYIALVCFFNKKFSERLYPVAIFLISISLLLIVSLRSDHIIIGTDTGREFYFFRMVLNNQHWSVFENALMDACLSISLLPTIYQSILSVRAEFIFKVLYSLIFSVSPLVIYTLCKKYIGSYYSFLASFFFMSTYFFQWTASLARVNMAVLFLALAIMVLFNDKIHIVIRKSLFIIFAVSIILSHYSTAYITFFMLLFVCFGLLIVSKIGIRRGQQITKKILKTNMLPASMQSKESTSRSYTDDQATNPGVSIPTRIGKNITITFVIIFFAVLFLWYSQLTGECFYTGVTFVKTTFLNLNDFFLMESRETTVPSTLGANFWQKEIPQKIGGRAQYIAEYFI